MEWDPELFFNLQLRDKEDDARSQEVARQREAERRAREDEEEEKRLAEERREKEKILVCTFRGLKLSTDISETRPFLKGRVLALLKLSGEKTDQSRVTVGMTLNLGDPSHYTTQIIVDPYPSNASMSFLPAFVDAIEKICTVSQEIDRHQERTQVNVSFSAMRWSDF